MPLPTSLVVKKGSQHAGQNLRRDAAAGIRDGDHNVIPAAQLGDASVHASLRVER